MSHILDIKMQNPHFILAKRSRMVWVEKGDLSFLIDHSVVRSPSPREVLQSGTAAVCGFVSC